LWAGGWEEKALVNTPFLYLTHSAPRKIFDFPGNPLFMW